MLFCQVLILNRDTRIAKDAGLPQQLQRKCGQSNEIGRAQRPRLIRDPGEHAVLPSTDTQSRHSDRKRCRSAATTSAQMRAIECLSRRELGTCLKASVALLS